MQICRSFDFSMNCCDANKLSSTPFVECMLHRLVHKKKTPWPAASKIVMGGEDSLGTLSRISLKLELYPGLSPSEVLIT